MMNKEFVPYKEALALKELGFNESCICKWEEDYLCQDEGFDICNDDTWLTNKKLYFFDAYCTAPTFSQAFRWFRDKYKLYHNITQYNGESFFFKIEDMVFPRRYDEYSVKKLRNFEEYSSIDDAELGSLQKLIEIVKNEI